MDKVQKFTGRNDTLMKLQEMPLNEDGDTIKIITAKEIQRTRKILIGLNYWVIKAEQA